MHTAAGTVEISQNISQGEGQSSKKEDAGFPKQHPPPFGRRLASEGQHPSHNASFRPRRIFLAIGAMATGTSGREVDCLAVSVVVNEFRQIGSVTAN